jgi:hypothetical protein
MIHRDAQASLNRSLVSTAEGWKIKREARKFDAGFLILAK